MPSAPAERLAVEVLPAVQGVLRAFPAHSEQEAECHQAASGSLEPEDLRHKRAEDLHQKDEAETLLQARASPGLLQARASAGKPLEEMGVAPAVRPQAVAVIQAVLEAPDHCQAAAETPGHCLAVAEAPGHCQATVETSCLQFQLVERVRAEVLMMLPWPLQPK